MALRFTAEGAVGAPTSLQLRVGRGRPSRIRVGAPEPSRELSLDEVLYNARHFLEPGPRSAPVQRVVLSGLPDAWLAGPLSEAVEILTASGIERVVAHLDETQIVSVPKRGFGCDLVVTSCTPRTIAAATISFSLTIPLVPEVLDHIDVVMEEAAALRPVRVTWVWPFPDGTASRPVPAGSVAEILARNLGRWRQPSFPWGIKGLPRCTLRQLDQEVSLAGRIWRTRNRYYVDADHQRSRALMFEPDLVQLVKSDRCRFCAVDGRCDGVAERWLAEGLVLELLPLETP